MADAKKKPASDRLYGKSPRLAAEPAKGDKDKSGHMAEADGEAKKTAGDPETKANTDSGGKAGADVMAGTDGVPIHHEHSAQRMDLYNRHMREHTDLIHRQDKEHMMRALGHAATGHAEMNAGHEKERQQMHTRHETEWRTLGARHAGGGEKEIGKSGSQPT